MENKFTIEMSVQRLAKWYLAVKAESYGTESFSTFCSKIYTIIGEEKWGEVMDYVVSGNFIDPE